jgi:hypothetical protein
VHLDAERLEGGAWRVSGGASVHEVTADASACDCADFTVHGGLCKHILAVRLRSGDRDVVDGLRVLVAPPRAR